METSNLEMTRGTGAFLSPVDLRDYTIIPLDIEFPKEFCTKKVHVKNQWTESSCVAHAVSSVVEYHYYNLTNTRRTFSTEFIYGYREYGYWVGDGMYIRNALNTIHKYGVPYKEDCPGNNNYKKAMKNVNARLDELKELAYPHRISAYVKLNSIEEMKTSLMINGPLIASMKWYDGFRLVKDTYTFNPEKKFQYHCVMICGWNESGWIVQNSWGVLFGDKGRFIVPFDFQYNEVWGVIDDIDDTQLKVVKPNNNATMDVIYKVLNFAINLIHKLFKKSE